MYKTIQHLGQETAAPQSVYVHGLPPGGAVFLLWGGVTHGTMGSLFSSAPSAPPRTQGVVAGGEG